MKENWVIKKHNPKLVERISSSNEISPITSQILVTREIKTPEEAHQFLNASLFDLPSPYLMKGMETAVDRVISAIEDSQMIAIYGDYDVDGVTSTALLYNFLKEIGARVTYYNPERLKEGYGINFEAVEKLKQQGVKLIISGDCGITAYEEVKRAKDIGIDFIITDHHKPPEKTPEAIAVLNPHISDCNYPGKEIAGVGVIFNLAIAIRRKLRETDYFNDNEPNLGDYLDLVALGTVADCASLVNVNRILVKEGIKRMHSPKRPGLYALKAVSGVKGLVNTYDIGFRLGPRINASGRLNSAKEAVELFISNNPAEAKGIAEILNEQNERRQSIEADILKEAYSLIESEGDFADSNSIVISSEGWHQGVIGIVASRIVEKYRKPSFLIAIDENGVGKGSGRSIEGVNIYSALLKCNDLFDEFGGHELAAGITIKKSNIEEFRSRLDKELEGYSNEYIKKIEIDGLVELSDISFDLISEMNLIAPYGIGNPEPLFLAESLEILSHRKINDKHLNIKLRYGSRNYDAIWFNSDYEIDISKNIDIVFSPEINIWNGNKSIRLKITDAYQD